MLVVKIDEKRSQWKTSKLWKRKARRSRKGWLLPFRINPDKPGFDDYEEFGRVSSYITKSIKKQNDELTKKSLIDDLSKRLLELGFKSNPSIKSKV